MEVMRAGKFVDCGSIELVLKEIWVQISVDCDIWA